MRACARVASNYPFAKLMEIAETVPTGRVRATSDKILNLRQIIVMGYVEVFSIHLGI